MAPIVRPKIKAARQQLNAEIAAEGRGNRSEAVYIALTSGSRANILGIETAATNMSRGRPAGTGPQLTNQNRGLIAGELST
jgi:hypothetical protein